MSEIDDDHRKMLADRLAREQAATPLQLGQFYGNALQPYQPTQQERIDAMVRETAVRREYHFGTDIPVPSQDEVAEAMAQRIPREKRLPIVFLGLAAWGLVLAFAAAVLYLVTR